jgi:eukaryotic-like serine/threonine-protein kinase
MALQPGTILGSYEILQQIGAGGMGEVYKANDRRLGRQVAVKALPAQFSGQEDFRQRFEREAQVIAGLNHPNICTLYDVGKQDGTDFLVMELLDGETMAARLERGPIPLEEALRIAIQIADALEKAHSIGVTHRDLKPSNIMLTKSGAKLMDFGLAKRRVIVDASGSAMPTVTGDLTQHGSIIGTVQYMAPEQIEGEEADPRTDIFALGTVLYEMVTGKKAFTGKSQASLMASILQQNPAPMSALQPVAPPSLQRVVEICMAKDPASRWQSAHDVMLQLKWIAEGGSAAGVPAPVAHRRKNRERSAWIIAGVAVLAALALGALSFRNGTPPDPRVVRYPVWPNTGTAFGGPNAPIRPFPAVSPDGTGIVFQAQEPNEPTMLWVRQLDSLESRPLTGTENAFLAFWSPDSQNIGFYADGRIKRVPAAGGPVQDVCEATQQAESTWGNGTILFGNTARGGLFAVPDTGGEPVQITTPNKELKETLHRAPFFLPDGQHFLYLAQSPNVLWVGSLDPSEPPKRLRNSDSRGIYASGHVLFVSQGILMAQKFDADSLELSGEAAPVAEDVVSAAGNGRAAFSASNDGTLVYRTGRALGIEGLRVVSFDRKGNPTDTINQSEDNRAARFSPDEKRIVVERRAPAVGCSNCTNLWIIDLERGTNTSFSDNPEDELNPIWSPTDGRSIVYRANPDGVFALYQKETTGVARERLLLKLDQDQDITQVSDWSTDGKYILFTSSDPVTGSDLWYLQLGESKPKRLVGAKANQTNARFSRDGRWVAYQSNESGTMEIYVVDFPMATQRVTISVDGGTFPRWRRDGTELVFRRNDRSVIGVDLRATSTGIEPIGKPRVLFTHPLGAAPFEMSADGTRFLFSVVPEALRDSNAEDSPLTVVLNWTATLKR